MAVIDLTRLLGNLQTFGFLFRKVTPRELTTGGLQLALRAAGIELDMAQFGKVYNKLITAKGQNLYAVLSEPAFQQELQALVNDTSDHTHVADCRVFASCPRCGLSFVANPGQFAESLKERPNAADAQQAAEPDHHQ